MGIKNILLIYLNLGYAINTIIKILYGINVRI